MWCICMYILLLVRLLFGCEYIVVYIIKITSIDQYITMIVVNVVISYYNYYCNYYIIVLIILIYNLSWSRQGIRSLNHGKHPLLHKTHFLTTDGKFVPILSTINPFSNLNSYNPTGQNVSTLVNYNPRSNAQQSSVGINSNTVNMPPTINNTIDDIIRKQSQSQINFKLQNKIQNKLKLSYLNNNSLTTTHLINHMNNLHHHHTNMTDSDFSNSTYNRRDSDTLLSPTEESNCGGLLQYLAHGLALLGINLFHQSEVSDRSLQVINKNNKLIVLALKTLGSLTLSSTSIIPLLNHRYGLLDI